MNHAAGLETHGHSQAHPYTFSEFMWSKFQVSFKSLDLHYFASACLLTTLVDCKKNSKYLKTVEKKDFSLVNDAYVSVIN